MKLAEAIHKAIEEQGIQIMENRRLLNILDDYNAFDDLKAAKHIMSILIDNAYISKLFPYYNKHQNADVLMQKLMNDLRIIYGIDIQVSNYVCNELVEGLILDCTKHDNTVLVGESVCGGDTPKSDHLCFKNIPITGSRETFIKRLLVQGFKITDTNNKKVDYLKGQFIGIDDCEIRLEIGEHIPEVRRIWVSLPLSKSWIDLKNIYLKFKERLTIKYGEPDRVMEFFNSPYKDGDGQEIKALKYKNKAFFGCYFIIKSNDTNIGRICLRILSDRGYGEIQLVYSDDDTCNRDIDYINRIIDDDI